MPEPIIAWQCIGCGKLEAPQTCIGVCEDRKVELLPAHHHAEAIAQLDDARNALAQWHNLAHRLLQTTPHRSEEHTSELQSLMRISYAVFCLKKKKQKQLPIHQTTHNTTN